MARDDMDDVDTKYGKRLTHERNYKAPLWRKRSCTDVPCLLVFLVFLGAWVFIAQYALRNGDLNKLVVPTDSFNKKCGIDSGVLDKKYLFFFNLDKCLDPLVPITGCPTPQICVSQCPKETFIWDIMKKQMSEAELKSRMICLTDADKNALRNVDDMQKAIDEERCARWYIKSAPFLNRCMWEFSAKTCEFIPSFLLQRSQRDLTNPKALTSAPIDIRNEDQLQALALTMFPEAQALVGQNVDPKLASVNEEPNSQCSRRETVIKEKMLQTDTRLSKFIGNIVVHFTNGTHEAQRVGDNVVEDIYNSYVVILTAMLCTLVATFIFIALMRWLAAPFLWTSIFGVLVGLAVAIYFSIKQYTFYHREATVPQHALNLNSAVKNVLQDERLWLYLSIFLCIFLVVLLLLLIVLRKRITIAVALIKEGSKAVSSVKSTVFFPIFTWILFIAAIVYAIGVGLYLGSIGKNSFRMIRQLDPNSISGVTQENCKCDGPAINYTVGASCDPMTFEQNCYIADLSITGIFRQNQRNPCVKTTCSFVKVEHTALVNWFIVYNVFGYLWLTFFIDAFSDMVLACTFATWYWTFKKKDVPFFTLTKSIFQTTFYHLGTLAFGSLILAICRMIRLILEYIDRKIKKYDNALTRAVLCCMKCFFWLLESFLKFLSKNAYIMCAIHGKNFCTSAKDAFNLTMRNFLRVVTLDKVTEFLFFMSKLLITGGAGVATYFFLLNNPSLLQLHYKAVPTAIVAILAFLITTVFFSVYSMAVDTLFLCFLEDIERNDGSAEKPYYMSKQLMKILGKRNKIPKRTP
ncbi:choline transporter-like 2 [Haematobia irritans]|uniref:choline transporter-like 2 n=1 Tax=Haematobia irritans TaxID=7368 RepID=UPI003F50917E